MGKLNVSMLRYLSREDFRVLTAVSIADFDEPNSNRKPRKTQNVIGILTVTVK